MLESYGKLFSIYYVLITSGEQPSDEADTIQGFWDEDTFASVAKHTVQT